MPRFLNLVDAKSRKRTIINLDLIALITVDGDEAAAYWAIPDEEDDRGLAHISLSGEELDGLMRFLESDGADLRDTQPAPGE